jgi:predicted dehydrogenase
MRIQRRSPVHLFALLAALASFFGGLPAARADARLCEGRLVEADLAAARAPRRPRIHLLIEGAGDVVERFYIPALAQLKAKYGAAKDITLTFTASSQNETPAAREKRLQIRAKILALGANYIDKADPADAQAYADLRPDYVVVATPAWTHVDLAQQWLARPRRPRRVFLEKPLDSSREVALDLLEQLDADDNQVLSLDHYRPKLNLSRAELNAIGRFLGDGLQSFRFYMLEDRSGADPTVKSYHGRDGAIEEEGRVSVMRDGVAMDMLSHMLAVLEYFGAPATVRPVQVWAGQYTGVDGDPTKPTEIPQETFFAARFVFRDHQGNRVQGEAAVGKGIRGVRALGPEYDHNAKLMEVVGRNGRRIVFDLRSSGQGAAQAAYYEADGTRVRTRPLEPEPYRAFLEGILTAQSARNMHSVHVEEGRAILEKLYEFRHPLTRQTPLPRYPGGMRGVREAPYVEDLLQMLPVLSGPDRH